MGLILIRILFVCLGTLLGYYVSTQLYDQVGKTRGHGSRVQRGDPDHPYGIPVQTGLIKGHYRRYPRIHPRADIGEYHCGAAQAGAARAEHRELHPAAHERVLRLHRHHHRHQGGRAVQSREHQEAVQERRGREHQDHGHERDHRRKDRRRVRNGVSRRHDHHPPVHPARAAAHRRLLGLAETGARADGASISFTASRR